VDKSATSVSLFSNKISIDFPSALYEIRPRQCNKFNFLLAIVEHLLLQLAGTLNAFHAHAKGLCSAPSSLIMIQSTFSPWHEHLAAAVHFQLYRLVIRSNYQNNFHA
jgi:hypothetical protein